MAIFRSVRRWLGRLVEPRETADAVLRDASLTHYIQQSVEDLEGNTVEEAAMAEDVTLDFEIIHKSEDEQIAYGVVMEPDVTDAHDHVADRAEIEKAMHSFMQKKWKPIGLQHTDIGYGIKIVENSIARADFAMGDEVVKEGSWFMGVHIPDAETWKDVKSGKYTGFSIGARARLEDVEE